MTAIPGAPVEPDEFGDSSVDEIAYNFDKWLPDELKGGRVVVPEPSTERVIAFWREWQAAFTHARRASEKVTEEYPERDDETPDERDDRIMAREAAGQEVAARLIADRTQVLSDVCSGTPSVETLNALPHRIRRAFEGYIAGKIGPEA